MDNTFDRIKEHLIFFNSINYYFENKYKGIEEDVEYIKTFDVTLGQQLKRLKDYEEYKILRPYMLPQTNKNMVNEDILNKIEIDLEVFERFTFKEDEVDNSAHFKDVVRCLKQERFYDNLFRQDVFVFCAEEKINYFDGIKLFFLKQHKKLSDLLVEFSKDMILKYENEGIKSVEKKISEIGEIGVSKNKIYYALLWSVNDNEKFQEIKSKICDYKIDAALKINYQFQKSNGVLFQEVLNNKKISWLSDTSINNSILSDIFSANELKCDPKELMEKITQRMIKHNWLLINEINNEELEVDIKKEWCLLKSNQVKLKGSKKDKKVIKQLFKKINLHILPKEVKNKISNTF